MKVQSFVLCFLLTLLSVSCIREEAPNAEADILSCTVDGDILKAEPEIDNESVTLTVKSDADITNLAPVFTLTPGTTIKPASGTAFDFTTPRTYTVTSEDGHWTKTYTVRCIVSGVSTEYHFEHITMEPKNERYQIFYDFTSNGDSVTWASGNAIFYETDENVKYLDGFNGLTSPNLISVARISDQKETDEWTRFYIPFVAKPGKVIDKDKLAKGGYQLSIVFSSSLKGDVFEGAEGSTLWIDEVEIIQSGEN